MAETKLSIAMNKLLECSICLERLKKPKMLPCQHNFCMEPCLIGLADYEKDEVKCPLCRKSYSLTDKGIQGFPNNLLLGMICYKSYISKIMICTG